MKFPEMSTVRYPIESGWQSHHPDCIDLSDFFLRSLILARWFDLRFTIYASLFFSRAILCRGGSTWPTGLPTGSPTVPYGPYPGKTERGTGQIRAATRIPSLSRLTGARGPTCRTVLSREETKCGYPWNRADRV